MQERDRPRAPGLVLCARLQSLGMSQSAFAEAVGVSPRTISYLISGGRRLTPALAWRIADALGDTPEDWMRLQLAVDLWDARPLGDDAA